MANFVCKWEVCCFDVYGTFLMSAILMSCIFLILRFLSKCSVRALYVGLLIDIILTAFFVV